MANYLIEQLDEVEPTPCPCGLAKRAFVGEPNAVASLHEVDIRQDSAVHYHKRTTEIYLVLEGEGHIELDGERVPVKPMTAVYIKPGCRHRAVGQLKIINIPIQRSIPATSGSTGEPCSFSLRRAGYCRLNPPPCGSRPGYPRFIACTRSSFFCSE